MNSKSLHFKIIYIPAQNLNQKEHKIKINNNFDEFLATKKHEIKNSRIFKKYDFLLKNKDSDSNTRNKLGNDLCDINDEYASLTKIILESDSTNFKKESRQNAEMNNARQEHKKTMKKNKPKTSANNKKRSKNRKQIQIQKLNFKLMITLLKQLKIKKNRPRIKQKTATTSKNQLIIIIKLSVMLNIKLWKAVKELDKQILMMQKKTLKNLKKNILTIIKFLK